MKLLMIEGDEGDFHLHERIFTEAYPEGAVVEWLPCPPDDLSVIDFSAYDICFVAQNIGQARGTDIIAQLRKDGCAVPLILMAESEGDDGVS